MPFGLYKDVKMEEVPATYLLHLGEKLIEQRNEGKVDLTLSQIMVLEYYVDNLDVLEKEVEEQKSRSQARPRSKSIWATAFILFFLSSFLTAQPSIPGFSSQKDRDMAGLTYIAGHVMNGQTPSSDLREYVLELVKTQVEHFGYLPEEVFGASPCVEPILSLGEYEVVQTGNEQKGHFYTQLRPVDLDTLNTTLKRGQVHLYTCDQDCRIRGPIMQDLWIKDYFPVKIPAGVRIRLCFDNSQNSN
jgi:hypothetical protein